MEIKRIPLKNNDIIILFKENPNENLNNKDKALKEKVYFKIKKFIGEGGSSLVYEVEKEDGTIGRLKEFYPINYDVKRIESGFLEFNEKNSYVQYKNKFIEGFEMQKKLYKKNLSAINNMPSYSELFYGNNTLYIFMSYDYGFCYNTIKNKRLKDILNVSLATARALKKYHEVGLLHLDIKAENVFVLYDTKEMIKLFDFDTVVEKNSLIHNHELFYSKNTSAPEILRKAFHIIDERADFYSLGAMVFFDILGRYPDIDDRRVFKSFNFNKEDKLFENIPPKFFILLSDFFNKTLSVNPYKRYRNDDEIINALKDLRDISCIKKPYLIDGPRWKPSKSNIGRKEEVKEIHERLEKNNIVFIYAEGGIGKTELSKLYGEVYKENYHTIIYKEFNNSIKETILGIYFGNLDDEKDGYSIEELYYIKLNNLLKADNKTLLIIDNFNSDEVKGLKELLNPMKDRIKIIFTTRNFIKSYEDYYLKLNELSEEECIELFFKYNPSNNKEIYENDVKELLKLINYNTLLIKLVASSLEEGLNQPSYMIKNLKNASLKDVKVKVHHESKSEEYKTIFSHLCAIFDIDSLKKKNMRKERYIMCNMAFISLEGIDKKVFLNYIENKEFKDIVNELNSLIRKNWIQENEEKKISLHPIISDLIYEVFGYDEKICGKLIKSMIKIFNNELSYKEMEENTRRLEFVENRINKSKSKLSLELYCTLGINFNKEGQYKKSSRYLKKALNISIKKNDIEKTALIYDNIGLNYYSQGNSYDALKYLNKGLEIKKKNYGENHIKTAPSYNNIGLVYKDMEKYKKALDNLFKSIKIREKHYKLKNKRISYNKSLKEIASTYNNVALVYKNLGNYKKSLKYMFTCLNIRKKINDENLALSYNNIAGIYMYLKDYKSAIKYCSIGKELSYEDKFTYSLICNNIGKMYKEEKAFNKALKFCMEGLNVRLKEYGEKNLLTGESYICIGEIYYSLKDYVKALDFFKKALEIEKEHEKSTIVSELNEKIRNIYYNLEKGN